MTFLENPFWAFSLTVYRGQVQEECRLLQDNEGVNVNLLLFCCWLSYAVEETSKQQFMASCQSIAEWHEQVTKPLRIARRYLKSAQKNDWVTDFAQSVLMTEITSESYQQELLFNQYKDQLKEQASKDDSLAERYLHWLFEYMNHPVDYMLDKQLQQFVELAHQQIK